MSVQILIDRNVFSDFFNVYYKIESEFEIDCYKDNQEDYDMLEKEKDRLKSDIKNMFDYAVKDGITEPLNNRKWRIVFNNDSLSVKKNVEFSDKIKLYRFILFNCELIDEWIDKHISDYIDREAILYKSKTLHIYDYDDHTNVDLIKKIYDFNRSEEDIEYIEKEFIKKFGEDWKEIKNTPKICSKIKNINCRLYNDRYFDLLEIFDSFLNNYLSPSVIKID